MRQSNSAPNLLAVPSNAAPCGHQQGAAGRRAPLQGGGREDKGHKKGKLCSAVPEAAASLPSPSFLDHILQQAEEAGFGASRGLAASECFELYGLGDAAPPVSALQRGEELTPEERATAEQDEQLAACLLSPMTAQERNAGQLLQSSVRRAGLQSEVDTQLRYLRELNREVCISAKDNVEYLYAQGPGPAHRLRRRRRPRTDSALDLLYGLEDTADAKRRTRLPPADVPEVRRWAELHGSAAAAGAANTLTLEEGEAREPGLPTRDGVLFSIDPDPEEEPGEAEGDDPLAATAPEAALTRLIARLGKGGQEQGGAAAGAEGRGAEEGDTPQGLAVDAPQQAADAADGSGGGSEEQPQREEEGLRRGNILPLPRALRARLPKLPAR